MLSSNLARMESLFGSEVTKKKAEDPKKNGKTSKESTIRGKVKPQGDSSCVRSKDLKHLTKEEQKKVKTAVTLLVKNVKMLEGEHTIGLTMIANG